MRAIVWVLGWLFLTALTTHIQQSLGTEATIKEIFIVGWVYAVMLDIIKK